MRRIPVTAAGADAGDVNSENMILDWQVEVG